MPTRTRFVFLMHPKEYKEEKAGTGRLTHLCLPNSELHMGKGFDDHAALQAVLADPGNSCVLLYPGTNAVNLSEGGSREGERVEQGAGSKGQGGRKQGEGSGEHAGIVSGSALHALRSTLEQRQLVVILLDATWSGARKMLRLSRSLQVLPRIMFTPSAPSRYIIKQQPQEGCLSTLEAVHELLTVLAATGLDHYERPAQLLEIFQRMQDFQMKCAADPARPGYRRKPYGDPADRKASRGDRSAKRDNFMHRPVGEATNSSSI